MKVLDHPITYFIGRSKLLTATNGDKGFYCAGKWYPLRVPKMEFVFDVDKVPDAPAFERIKETFQEGVDAIGGGHHHIIFKDTTVESWQENLKVHYKIYKELAFVPISDPLPFD
jgi:hypothetical protein